MCLYSEEVMISYHNQKEKFIKFIKKSKLLTNKIKQYHPEALNGKEDKIADIVYTQRDFILERIAGPADSYDFNSAR